MNSPRLPPNNRPDLSDYFAPEKKVQLSGELLNLTTQAFAKSLSRETWKGLIENYPEIQGTESVLTAPKMEAGMKEDIQRKHGYNKTKEVFTFDEGLADKQATFLLTARPILAALTALDGTGEELDEDDTPDPDTIKGMLEDALVLLGNANARLNSWCQRRFADFLTPIGKRTLKEEIPTDKHLFADELHELIKSEHSHSTTNNSLVSKPAERPRFQPGKSTNFQKPFRGKPTYNSQPAWRKRKWGYNSKGNSSGPTGAKRRFPTPDTKDRS